MTNKERVMKYCMEHLSSRNLTSFFDSKAFNYIYKKKHGTQANPYTLGLHAADYIITNAKPFNSEIQDEK